MFHPTGNSQEGFRFSRQIGQCEGLTATYGETLAIKQAFEAVSDKGSYQNLMKVMDLSHEKIAHVLARKNYEGIPPDFAKSFTQVGKAHSEGYPGIKGENKLAGLLGDQDFGAIMYKFFKRGLVKGLVQRWSGRGGDRSTESQGWESKRGEVCF